MPIRRASLLGLALGLALAASESHALSMQGCSRHVPLGPYRYHSPFCSRRCPYSRSHLLALSDPNSPEYTTKSAVQDYVSLLRPLTLIQAVGAWVVGRLLLISPKQFADPKEWVAMMVVYLSYGVGMVANDCADASVDSTDNAKRKRAIASGRVSTRQGWFFVAMLTILSLSTACFGVSPSFGLWVASNIGIMLLYAAGLQRLLLLKNIMVGWLCISPLWGATTMATTAVLNSNSARMSLLATTGFSLGVIREILKDIQDIELDRGTKFTLPLWIGAKAAQRISFAALGITFAVLQTPTFRRLFATSPLYSMAWIVASMLCLFASRKPTIAEQQAGVKQSIYILLIGLIGNMMLAK